MEKIFRCLSYNMADLARDAEAEFLETPDGVPLTDFAELGHFPLHRHCIPSVPCAFRRRSALRAFLGYF